MLLEVRSTYHISFRLPYLPASVQKPRTDFRYGSEKNVQLIKSLPKQPLRNLAKILLQKLCDCKWHLELDFFPRISDELWSPLRQCNNSILMERESKILLYVAKICSCYEVQKAL